jgi:hypothetical protein
MNVVNYSSGSLIYGASDENGPDARAIAQAVANGVLVVAAAGNDGPGLGTISTPGASPAAIAVGAMQNERWFWYGVSVAGSSYYAIPSDEELEAFILVYGDTTGKIVDTATLTSDTGGYGCSAFPANSLTGSIALIQRGAPTPPSCSFETKLNNAQKAGAVGAIIYDNTSRPFFDYSMSGGDVVGFQLGLSAPPQDTAGNDLAVTWSMGNASLFSVMVSQADGLAIKQAIAGSTGLTADIDFDGKTSLPYPSNSVVDFSSLGPSPLGSLKPDVVAVGDWLVAPSTSQYEDFGCAYIGEASPCYPPYTLLDSGFTLNFFYGFGYNQLWDDGGGTSFATPIVTGSIAVLMGARPGLSAAQYRSLITNGSAELDLYPNNNIAYPTYAGGGKLDLLGSMQAGLTAVPSTVNFAAPVISPGGSTSSAPVHALIGRRKDSTAAATTGGSQTVSLTNVGSADTFSVVVNSIDGIATPAVDSTSFTLAAGASQNLNLSLAGAATLASAQYHGFVVVTGTQGQTPLRIPYWYGVVGPATSALGLYIPFSDPPSCTDYIDFRLLDASGMPASADGPPTVTTTSTRAAVVSVYPISDFFGDYNTQDYIPGTYEAQITTGRPDGNGNNVFTITSGSFTTDVLVGIDTSAGSCSTGATVAARGTISHNPVSKGLGKKVRPNRGN